MTKDEVQKFEVQTSGILAVFIVFICLGGVAGLVTSFFIGLIACVCIGVCIHQYNNRDELIKSIERVVEFKKHGRPELEMMAKTLIVLLATVLFIKGYKTTMVLTVLFLGVNYLLKKERVKVAKELGYEI